MIWLLAAPKCGKFYPISALSQTNLNQIKLAMSSTNGIFNRELLGKRNLDALDQIYTSGARILPPGGPMITGRPAIKGCARFNEGYY